jgi:Neurotransmitter-gated ion-channel ligand binding domain
MNLRWNASEHGGVKDLRIPPHRIWKPDVLMYNRYESHKLLSTLTYRISQLHHKTNIHFSHYQLLYTVLMKALMVLIRQMLWCGVMVPAYTCRPVSSNRHVKSILRGFPSMSKYHPLLHEHSRIIVINS